MALQPVDWEVWKQRARSFVQSHPTVRGLDLTRSERLVIPGAKEAFAALTFKREAQVRALGGQPCCRCGLWTASWCEGCEQKPPAPVCTECDREHLLCPGCVSRGRLFLEVARQPEPTDTEIVEISGFQNGDDFVSVDPPLRVPLDQIPLTEDGVYDLAGLLERLRPDLA